MSGDLTGQAPETPRAEQAGFWDIDERYARLSEAGDPLEKLNSVVPWEVFRKPQGPEAFGQFQGWSAAL
jgi:hypothetical protein